MLDCSIALSWLLPDESSAFAEQTLERVAIDGAIVPTLFKLEVGNTLLIAVRRRRMTAETRDRAFERIGSLPLEEDRHGAEQVWTNCVALAEKHNLSLYDATYLELAQRLRKPLATLDTRLALAARQIGLAAPWSDA